MSGNARFHDKLHRANHHTAPTGGLPDSSYDPIASPAFPFQGTFSLSGDLSASGNILSNSLDVITNTSVSGNLSVYGDVSQFDTQVNVTSLMYIKGPVYLYDFGAVITDGINLADNGPLTVTLNFGQGVFINPSLNVGQTISTQTFYGENIVVTSAYCDNLTVSNSANVGHIFSPDGVFTDVHVLSTVLIDDSLTARNTVTTNTLYTTDVVASSAIINNLTVTASANVGHIFSPDGVFTDVHVLSTVLIDVSLVAVSSITTDTLYNNNAIVSSGYFNNLYVAASANASHIFSPEGTFTDVHVLSNTVIDGRLGVGVEYPQHTVHIVGDMVIYGTLTANGNSYFQNTIFTTTSALSIVNTGTGAALTVSQEGDQPIIAFYDHESSISLFADGSIDHPGWVGVKTTTPNVEFTVQGDISASGTVYGIIPGLDNVRSTSASWGYAYAVVSSTSGAWDTSYSTLTSNSAYWESNLNTTRSNSAYWESDLNTTRSNSAYWSLAYTTLTANSARWNTTYSEVTSNSANWSLAYTTLTSNSGSWTDSNTILQSGSARWDNNYTGTVANSSLWDSVYTTVFEASAIWNMGGSGGAASPDVEIIVSELSAYWETTHNTVSSSSARWDSSYTIINTNSAAWNYNTTLLNTNSAIWNNTSTALNASSATWKNTTTSLNASSAIWNSSTTVLNTTSAIWNNTYNSVNTNNLRWSNTSTYVNSNSANTTYNSLSVVTLSAGSLKLTNASVQTFTAEITAGGDFLVININGVDRKIQLWD